MDYRMNLTEDNLKCIFLLSSSDKTEDRHIGDILLALPVLKKKTNDISIFVDNYDLEQLNRIIKDFSSMNNITIETCDKFYQYVANCDRENLAIFVTGHSDGEKIDSKFDFTKEVFYSNLQKNGNLKNVMIFFGQCDSVYYADFLKTNKEQIYYIFGASVQESLSLESIGNEIDKIGNEKLSEYYNKGFFTTNLFLLGVYSGFNMIFNEFDIVGLNLYLDQFMNSRLLDEEHPEYKQKKEAVMKDMDLSKLSTEELLYLYETPIKFKIEHKNNEYWLKIC